MVLVGATWHILLIGCYYYQQHCTDVEKLLLTLDACTEMIGYRYLHVACTGDPLRAMHTQNFDSLRERENTLEGHLYYSQDSCCCYL